MEKSDSNEDFIWSFTLILLGEMSGTAFLMYFGCLGIVSDLQESKRLDGIQSALVWGALVCSIVMMFGHITRAHFNPTVTLCALLLRIINPITGVVYFTSQMVGAVFGYWILTLSVPSRMITGNLTTGDGHPMFCCTVINPEITPLQGFIAEFVATSFLIYAVCSAWDPRNAVWSDSVAIKIGFVIITLVLCTGPLTGASMNPARSFAPALFNRVWKHHWIYWLSTLMGSAVTTLTYKYTYLYDIDKDVRLREKLSDQLRQGSLYGKQEDTDQIRKGHPMGGLKK